MEKIHSAKFLRQRKMMVILPLLVIPFITMAFWALGGGQSTANNSQSKANTGLNLQLPDARLKDDKNQDKLSFYNVADADSLKRKELLSNDPFYRNSVDANPGTLRSIDKNLYNPSPSVNEVNNSPYKITADMNEQRIYKKINELNKQINQPETTYSSYANPNIQNQPINNNEQFSNEVDRLHNMMQIMNDKEEPDPEMQQLNSTLDKVLDIQNPQRAKDRLKEKSSKNKELVFVVSKIQENQNISLLDTNKNKQAGENKFYSMDKNAIPDEQNTIEAVIHESQTLMNGSIVKCRLLNNIYVNGELIPKGNFVFGLAQLNNERLEISITSIRNNSTLFPVNLEVYDMDGLPGIYIPGAISRDVAKQSADNGLQTMDLMTMDPSIKAQAAATGINAAKNFFGKKVRQVKVVVKAGYKILLKDKSL